MQETIGIIGAGQLGRMLALAGIPLGFRFRFLSKGGEYSCSDLGEVITGDWNDEQLLSRFSRELEVATLEFENVELETAKQVAAACTLRPGVAALRIAQDRLLEKDFFVACGLLTPKYGEVNSAEQLKAQAHEIGLPLVLKTRRLGYDGKGQVLIERPDQFEASVAALGGKNLIAEEFIKFERELSILAVRGASGNFRCYPLIQNLHHQGILRLSIAPAARVSAELFAQACAHAKDLCEHMDYCGVLAIEFFQRGTELLANEMAPRVHNSGHWSIEGAACSQFENHLRAVCGLPLGSTAVRTPSVMLNLVGDPPDNSALLSIPDAHLHLYAKDARPGRKLGHLTVLGSHNAELRERGLRAAQSYFPAELLAKVEQLLRTCLD